MDFRVRKATAAFEFRRDSEVVVRSTQKPFGVCGRKTIALFDRPRDTVVYGLGEKTGRLDKSNRSYLMWNVDAVADHPHSYMRDDYDPAYVSIPFYISRYESNYFGILLDNPYATFIHAGAKSRRGELIGSRLEAEDQRKTFALSAADGVFVLYLIPGPTLGDVVRRFARLAGRHELPPVWALGYHQARWGYKSAREVGEVADELAEAGIPVGALWLDIEHMDGYRVFTYDPKSFNDDQRQTHFQSFRTRDSRLVTIIDPGVKMETGFHVHDKGVRKDVFCKTPEGTPFVGHVWPGETFFPDFSLQHARDFWARHIQRHLESGVDGIWNDMNDPACGTVNLDDMLFDEGRASHAAYHNQYGHLMAKATWDGFRLHNPDARPFILTRSACTGTQKYAAIWTGDNCSNEQHLAMSIPMSLNLALSGVSFNGPDVGGFDLDTQEDLMVAWMLAGALFPFFRNHSARHTRRQEPYLFSRRALAVMRKCILTRAKLLPYLYNLFHRHWRDGDAVMRPLSYEFTGTRYERIDDQYMVGPHLLVAPFLQTRKRIRSVVLPPGFWFSLQTGLWIQGGRTVPVKRSEEMIVFVRDGSILPCVATGHLFPQPDFRNIEFHVFCKGKGAETEYYEDDRETRNYQRGEYAIRRIQAVRRRERLFLETETAHNDLQESLSSAPCYFYGLFSEGTQAANARWPFRTYNVRKATLSFSQGNSI
jgi:alpha-glucosidase